VSIAVAEARLRTLVARHGGVLDDGLDGDAIVARVGPSDRDEPADLAPVLNDRGALSLASPAKVLLVARAVEARVPGGRRWVHPRADLVLARLLDSLPEPSLDLPDFVEVAGARVARGVVLPPDLRLEHGAVIFPGVVLGARVRIGAGAVIGRVGFGFVDDEERRPLRIPHRAGVVLADGVEIGALCTVDAGVLSPTSIGEDSKLDAHVHVGHGVRIGARCRFAAQVGLAGSVIVEDDAWIGGQAGVADHCRIGRGARVAAKAGVIGDVPPGAVFAGYPAVARGRWLRGHAKLYRA
jgi:UDP-3-O-[3-hydroxymyristoyl] glucosamine N-acyltransferase